MSLAMFAAEARWTGQEIVDLLIASRRKHNKDLKLRFSYYVHTVEKAQTAAAQMLGSVRAQVEGDNSRNTFVFGRAPEESSVGAHGRKGASMDDSTRQTLLQLLSTKFGLPLLRVLKFTGDDPRYRLETGAGPVDLGDIKGLISQAKLRENIAARTGIYLPLIKRTVWPKYAKSLLSLCEDVDRGSDATREGTLEEWLYAYLDQRPPQKSLRSISSQVHSNAGLAPSRTSESAELT
jgi:hypothetical protein